MPRSMRCASRGLLLYGVVSLCLAAVYFAGRNRSAETGTVLSRGVVNGRIRDTSEADLSKADRLVIAEPLRHSPALVTRNTALAASQSNGDATSLLERATTRTAKRMLQASTPPPSLADRSAFPRIFFIGFGKSGTRALYDTLLMHPQLQGPIKEVRYFDIHYDKGLRWYLEQMPSVEDGVVVMEKSPSYIIHPISAQRLLEATEKLRIDPDTLKFVVMFRDPIQRAVSEYLEWKVDRYIRQLQEGIYQESLPPFVKMVYDSNGQVNLAGMKPLNTSVYSVHLSKWIHYFSPSQLCYVDGDNFVRKPYQEVRSLESCLGIKRFFTTQNFVYVPQRGFYCFRETPHSAIKCENEAKGRPHPPLPKQVLLDLKRAFQPYNDELQVLTKRNYSWF